MTAATVIATSFRGTKIAFADRDENEVLAPRHRRPVSAQEQMAVVLSGIRGEYPVPTLCRRHRITAAEYASWRRSALDGATASLAARPQPRAATPGGLAPASG